MVAVAAIGSRVTGALAAVSSFAWFDFFFTRPYERFSIASATDVTTAVLLLLVGLAVSQLAARARRMRVLAITDAGYLELIHRAGELSSSARSPDAVVDHVREALLGLLGLESCRFEYGSLLGQPLRLEPDGTVLAGHRRWNVDEFGFPARSPATARVVQAADPDYPRLWKLVNERNHGRYARYQTRTTRAIPLVAVTAAT